MKKHINILPFIVAGMIALLATSCNEDVLEETPLSFLSPDNAYTTAESFSNGIYGLHANAREEHIIRVGGGEAIFYEMSLGTDVAHTGDAFTRGSERFWDYSLITSFYIGSDYYWSWGYSNMIANANMIIARAENPDIEWTEEEKNAILGEARFFRAYTYNILVNIFGGVPIVRDEISAPKLDFVRSSREEVLEFIQEDLEFAIQWLPEEEEKDGRISQGAANHLLSEVYISLGLEKEDPDYYDKSIEAATRVIDSDKYELMTDRFGDRKDQPGDVFSDLFWDYNVNRGSGNKETIWALQFEYPIEAGQVKWSNWVRAWGPRFWSIKDPDGFPGMVICDSLGRPVGWIRPTNLVFYHVWESDWNDMRNSRFNIRRDWYYNNPESSYFGQKVTVLPTHDTIAYLYPYIRKIEGDFAAWGPDNGGVPKDIYKMRLAETYLLRAEAYMWKGDLTNAAADINVVRARAQATTVDPADVDIDYILDERIRELIIEEPRRRTLVRVGKMYERTLKYNYGRDGTGLNIQPHNELLPIPQSAIDANLGAELEQNPGY